MSVEQVNHNGRKGGQDTGVTAVDHDPAGNLKTRTDARGKTANYSYDSLNRISKIAYDDQTVNYTWYNCTNGISHLCSLANNNSSINYSYDSHGRITQKSQKSQNTGATPLTVSHSYNAAGQRTNSLSPGGQNIEYQWTGNRITAITSNGQPVISQISYEPDGQVNGWNWGNNQQNERFYDLSGRNIIVSMGFDAQSQMPDSRYYGYDAAGRLTSAIADSDPSLNQRHDYDQLDRLTGSQRGEPQLSRTDYSYDLSGNRSEKIKDTTILHSYNTDPNSNRLQNQSGAQTVSYSYDPAGNLTSDGTFSYSYNAAGRRIATTNTTTAQTTNYGYDAIGQRVTKTNAGNTTQFFYDEQGHLTGEYDASGQLIQEIIWLGDLPVAALKPATSAVTPDIYYIHADHLGTPRKITRPNDNRVVWSWESEAFGNSLPDQNPSGLGAFVFNLRFPGQYYDQETGLHYNMTRYYNPSIGGYDQSDLIGLRGGINTYAYVGGNPVNLVDPTGEAAGAAALCFIPGIGPVSCAAAGAATGAIICAINPAACKKAIQGCFDSIDRMFNEGSSPHIDPKEVAGKTPSQIDQIARDKGLIPTGDPKSGKGAYIDPVTGKQRVLTHPDPQSGCTGPHCHVNNPAGERLDINGNVVSPESPEAHLPLN
ncbi:RHS repeat-associated core domain-containing protein [Methylobacter tundripaludum]|uniref:RHS repeat-associated protein n=1 Tax=Methylobacter tundripaludum (strain ATCC BAA-1195 / DSM 17260 / SV96) TaxID=697282 RepID=G3ITW2_METTV|nr:RHS repeat-associated core domain-containing protein [Methylobacter tundripaludum]EGW21445.1 RHS repeat-associated protein [Methylobacter tundripaludum SV96]